MPVFDKYDISLDDKHRHWMFDVVKGLILQGVALFDEFGQMFNRTNPIPVELLPKAVFFGDFFTDLFGSSQIADDWRFTGTPIEVHNGTDNVYWTGTSIVGGSVTFDDASQAFDGTQSILIANMTVGDVFELDAGIAVDVSGHVALEIRVWVVGNYTVGDVITIEGWDGATVGTPVDLRFYIEETQTGMWQSAVIPLSDMGLSASTITGLRIRQGLKAGQGPTLNMDALKIQEAGGAHVFSVAAPPGFRIRLECIFITITDEFTLTATNNGSYGIPPLSFLSVPSVDNGILVAQVVNGVFLAQGLTKNFRDAAKFGFAPDVPLTDNTDTAVRIMRTFSPPIVIEGPAPLNSYLFIASDDFSGWTDGEIVWTGTIEPI